MIVRVVIICLFEGYGPKPTGSGKPHPWVASDANGLRIFISHDVLTLAAGSKAAIRVKRK